MLQNPMIIICFLCSDALWKIMSNYMVITCSVLSKYHEETLFRQLLHIYFSRLYYFCTRFIRYACAPLQAVPNQLTLETN